MFKIFSTLSLFLLGLLAMAHAEYKSSVPKAASVVKEMPAQIQLFFTESLELKLSSFKVYRLQADAIHLSPAQIRTQARALYRQLLLVQNDQDKRWDTGVKTTTRTTKEVVLGLKPGIKPGAYVVMWQNLGTDGHRVRGFYTFTYAPKASTNTTQPFTRIVLDNFVTPQPGDTDIAPTP